jgi:hypothetical protein
MDWASACFDTKLSVFVSHVKGGVGPGCSQHHAHHAQLCMNGVPCQLFLPTGAFVSQAFNKENSLLSTPPNGQLHAAVTNTRHRVSSD